MEEETSAATTENLIVNLKADGWLERTAVLINLVWGKWKGSGGRSDENRKEVGWGLGLDAVSSREVSARTLGRTRK